MFCKILDEFLQLNYKHGVVIDSKKNARHLSTRIPFFHAFFSNRTRSAASSHQESVTWNLRNAFIFHIFFYIFIFITFSSYLENETFQHTWQVNIRSFPIFHTSLNDKFPVLKMLISFTFLFSTSFSSSLTATFLSLTSCALSFSFAF